MPRRGGRFSFRFVALALAPTLFVALAAEAAVRLKYFYAHGHDWFYITTPFVRARAGSDLPTYVRPAQNQIVFDWQRPCVDRMVYSQEQHKDMPRTWDENCLRGDRITRQKAPDEYRIIFVGGSTVEDSQSDEEMMTAQVKRALPPISPGRRITVVNAGKAGYESRRVREYYETSLRAFSPDLVVYYEARNEQPTDVNWTRIDEQIALLRGRIHKLFYYRWILYTYLLEKYEFSTTSKQHFWKSDLGALRDNFTTLAREVRGDGARFVFVTQVLRFPRMWRGLDTFGDYHAVEAFLDRLKADPHYTYDAYEVSALNQRMAVGYTIELCRQLDVPVVNILQPVEDVGEAVRDEMFLDIGHMTVKGDRIVGELIAHNLRLLN
jgi:hypothetical protein